MEILDQYLCFHSLKAERAAGYFGHRASEQTPVYDFGTAMKKLKFLVSLTTNDNDYQIEQAADAESAAKRLGVDVQIIYADNDSITQSQQILNVIQSRSEAMPDGIVFEPVGGTALPQVARAAAAAGIGWVVLNRNVEYIAEIRKAVGFRSSGSALTMRRLGEFKDISSPRFCRKVDLFSMFKGPRRAWLPSSAPAECTKPSQPTCR